MYYMHMRVCYAYMCSAYVYMRVMYARVLCVAHTRSGVKYVCCILAYANSPIVSLYSGICARNKKTQANACVFVCFVLAAQQLAIVKNCSKRSFNVLVLQAQICYNFIIVITSSLLRLCVCYAIVICIIVVTINPHKPFVILLPLCKHNVILHVVIHNTASNAAVILHKSKAYAVKFKHFVIRFK